MMLKPPTSFEEHEKTPISYFSSNCRESRDAWVSDLMNHIDVTSYGKCLHNSGGDDAGGRHHYYHIWTDNPRFYSLEAAARASMAINIIISIYGRITLDSTPSRPQPGLRGPKGSGENAENG